MSAIRAALLPRTGPVPGFAMSVSLSWIYVGSLVIVPVLALLVMASRASFDEALAALFHTRTLSAYALSAGTSLAAVAFTLPIGVVLAWVLVRYDFPGRRLLDALIDVPFALPTAVSGIAIAALYGPNGPFGSVLAKIGLEVAHSPAGIAIALAFVALPFVVRTVQPVLEDFPREVEEAAWSLGASRFLTMVRVIAPGMRRAIATGATLAFARCLGEYGSVIFIAGNLPNKTEIAPLLVLLRLEEYDYVGATVIAVGLLTVSVVLLGVIRKLAGRPLSARADAQVTRARAPERPIGIAPRLAIGFTFGAIALLVLAPLALVIGMATREGLGAYAAAVLDPATLDALKLTVIVVAIVVPLNAILGVAVAWAVTHYRFAGRDSLLAWLDLPFAVSPVVAGLLFVLLFGARGWFGPLLSSVDVKVIFALPGIVLATLFVTMPFVARELIPVLEAQGASEEEAATTLGASGWTTLWRVTLPRVKHALLYGCTLCAARAAGEFGAVSVVSGHIRGQTATLPLHVEMLHDEYRATAAFAVASVLVSIGIVSLVLKSWLLKKGRPR